MTKESIILVDDNDMQDVTKALALDFPNFNIYYVDANIVLDIEKLKQYIRENKTRIIILDFDIPKSGFTNGIELLQILREEFPLISSILFTGKLLNGSDYGKDLLNCINVHLDYFVEKGDIEILIDAINKIIQNEMFTLAGIMSNLCEEGDISDKKPILSLGDTTLNIREIRDMILYGSKDGEINIRKEVINMFINVNSWLISKEKK